MEEETSDNGNDSEIIHYAPFAFLKHYKTSQIVKAPKQCAKVNNILECIAKQHEILIIITVISSCAYKGT